MLKAVIFDWFGTLATWDHDGASNYASVFRDHGYEVDAAVLDGYHTRWDGVDHLEHSASRDSYFLWTRSRLGELVSECGVPNAVAGNVVESLLKSDSGATMATFPESLIVLEELKRRNIPIAVCSNWGWDLEPFLRNTGVAPYVDVPVTSAQAGYRKPHPAIYETTLKALGIPATEAVFIGDSWQPDVVGPISVGMTSVHVCRDPLGAAPELVRGAFRVTSLEQLFDLAVF